MNIFAALTLDDVTYLYQLEKRGGEHKWVFFADAYYFRPPNDAVIYEIDRINFLGAFSVEDKDFYGNIWSHSKEE